MRQQEAPAAPRMQAEPNVTPMIDVLMVLLIIFMVLVPLTRRAVDVAIPDPEPGIGTPAAFVLEVGVGGRLALNRQPVAEAALGARLRAVYAGRRDRSLVVEADRRVPYQQVVAALDSARGAGARAIAFGPRRR